MIEFTYQGFNLYIDEKDIKGVEQKGLLSGLGCQIIWDRGTCGPMVDASYKEVKAIIDAQEPCRYFLGSYKFAPITPSPIWYMIPVQYRDYSVILKIQNLAWQNSLSRILGALRTPWGDYRDYAGGCWGS